MLFAVSDVVWQALIAGVVAIILGYLQMRTRSAVVRGNKDAAGHVAEVREALATSNETAQQTHKIVNSQRTEMMDKIDELQRQLNAALNKVDRQ